MTKLPWKYHIKVEPEPNYNLKDFVNFGILEQYGVHLLPAGLGDKVSLIRLGWSVILVILDKSATCRLYTWFFFTALFIHSSHFEVTAK